ncbi:hypothetical protein V8E36_003959 [Tilletia maclaganii]
MIVIPVQSAAELLPPADQQHTTSSASSSASASLTSSKPSQQHQQQHRQQQQQSRHKASSPAASSSSLSSSSSTSSSRSASLAPDDFYSSVNTPAFGKLSKDIARDFGRLYEAVAGARRIVVICGAGISVSAPANIPDFRSSSGLFQKLKDQHPNAGLTSGKDLFDARLFNSEKTSDLFYTMIAELKEMADQAQPTAFHHFLKRLDVEGRLLRVYTQNIDGLEERAGLTFGLKASPAEGSSSGLGKRKRVEPANPSTSAATGHMSMAKKAAWARSQSDSAVLWSRRASPGTNGSSTSLEKDAKAPMFPRTIPLHGSLNSMTCGRCGHQEILENAFKTVAESLAEYEAWRLSQNNADEAADSSSLSTAHQSTLQPDENESVKGEEEPRRIVPELKRLAIHEVLASLRAGEHIPCPRCETADEVRLAAGLRSRGVGRMKPDVVLYGGQNDGAERVGECLQRDILGLRDPNETAVPETVAEIRARERRALKEGGSVGSPVPVPVPTSAAPAATDVVLPPGGASISLEVVENASQEDTLGSFFADEDDEEASGDGAGASANEAEDQLGPLDTSIAAAAAAVSGDPLGERPNKLAKVASKGKAKTKLKPLPPDLLIVAGTSLKVSGTKRIIREFAKACHARDYRYYPGDDDSDEAEASSDGRGSSPSSRRRRQRKRSASREAEEEEEKNEDSDEEDDPSSPIRTILLNYEFPAPSSQWEDVFDIWIQGDVQAAARGLWPMPETNTAFGALPISEDDEEATNVAACLAGVNPTESWAHLKDHLDEQRALEKKYKGKFSAVSLKRKAKEEEESMPPKLMALSLSQFAALPAGSAKPVPLPQLGRKRSFVKAKTLASVPYALAGGQRSVSFSPLSSRFSSPIGAGGESQGGASDSSSLTSLAPDSPRSSPPLSGMEWGTGFQAGSAPCEFEILITPPKGKGAKGKCKGQQQPTSQSATTAVAATTTLATAKGTTTVKSAPSTPKTKRTSDVDPSTPKSGSKKTSSTPKKVATPPKEKVTSDVDGDITLEIAAESPKKKTATPTKSKKKAAAAETTPSKASTPAKRPVGRPKKATAKAKATSSAAPAKKAKATVKSAATAKVKKAAVAAGAAANATSAEPAQTTSGDGAIDSITKGKNQKGVSTLAASSKKSSTKSKATLREASAATKAKAKKGAEQLKLGFAATTAPAKARAVNAATKKGKKVAAASGTSILATTETASVEAAL